MRAGASSGHDDDNSEWCWRPLPYTIMCRPRLPSLLELTAMLVLTNKPFNACVSVEMIASVVMEKR